MTWRKTAGRTVAGAAGLAGNGAAAQTPAPRGPLVHTYSIVARDPQTGELGVAVQSHWFSVGSIVTWGEAGVGVVATQSFVDPGYGPRGLALMRSGVAAPEALEQLVAADANRDGRQVAMIDTQGRVDAYTGKTAVAAAGHVVGAGVSAQANMMGQAAVWPAMARRLRAGQRRPGRSPDRGARSGGGRRWRPARPAVGGVADRQGGGHRPAMGRRRSAVRSADRGSPRAGRGIEAAGPLPARLRARQPRRRADDGEESGGGAGRDREASRLAPEVLELPGTRRRWPRLAARPKRRRSSRRTSPRTQWGELLGRRRPPVCLRTTRR